MGLGLGQDWHRVESQVPFPGQDRGVAALNGIGQCLIDRLERDEEVAGRQVGIELVRLVDCLLVEADQADRIRGAHA